MKEWRRIFTDPGTWCLVGMYLVGLVNGFFIGGGGS